MRPYITLTSVDLPAPFSPSRAWISAGNRSRSMPSLARKEPYRLVILMARNSGSVPNEVPCGGTSCIAIVAYIRCYGHGFHSRSRLFQGDIIGQNRRQQKEANSGNDCPKRRHATAAPTRGAPSHCGGAELHLPDLLRPDPNRLAKNRSFDVALFSISSCAERVSILSQ